MKISTRPIVSGGLLLREARERHGVSQGQLATRAGTRQSAISRIEADKVSPSVDTLRELMRLMGEDLILTVKPRDFGVDATLNEANLEYTPSQRIHRGLAFADVVRDVRGESSGRAGP
jgi:transcriptional regulator with XRE-family HTH domain